MIAAFLAWTESIIQPWGGWGVFVGSIVEEVIVPIPSAMVQMGGGFFLLFRDPLSLEGFLKLFLLVVLPASVGVAVGSLPAYWVSRVVGRPIVDHFTSYLGLSHEDVDTLSKKMENRKMVFPIIFISRALPVIPSSVVSTVSGILKVNFFLYLFGSLAGTFIRAGVLGFIGWQVGEAYRAAGVYIERFEHIGLSLFLIGVIFWFIKKRQHVVKEDTPTP